MTRLSAGSSAAEQLLTRHRTERCVCWWSGSRSSRRIGGRPEVPRLGEFRTAGRVSFGIRTPGRAALNEMAKQRPPQPQPACCIQKGFYWDEAILYAPHGRWRDAPASIFGAVRFSSDCRSGEGSHRGALTVRGSERSWTAPNMSGAKERAAVHRKRCAIGSRRR